ncbi:MAG TPA: hypothetical protein VK907_13640, partial [Phnomibacter sp.]|nr:hypothetical protein [Phnomibacter sp.]
MNPKTFMPLDALLKIRTYFFSKNEKRDDPHIAYYAELFNDEQSEKHGKLLAGAHRPMNGNRPERLLNRLEENETILLEVRKLLVESVRVEKNISPASVWLLDNFYLIEEQIAIARKHLPKGYSKSLPYVMDGASTSIPRIYDIVSELISHSDGRVDIKGLSRFVAAYQTTTLLTLGELWAIPIMLRLAVIENLRRVGVMIALDMIGHH